MTQSTLTTNGPALPRLDSARLPADPAWAHDCAPTNKKLADGDLVVLNTSTRGDFSAGYYLVPAGTRGTVIRARTPRVHLQAGTKSPWFANVDVLIDGYRGRIRVPHGALTLVQKAQVPTPIRA